MSRFARAEDMILEEYNESAPLWSCKANLSATDGRIQWSENARARSRKSGRCWTHDSSGSDVPPIRYDKMHKSILFSALLICTPAAATAQQPRDYELFGGYSHLRFGDIHFNGWNASIAQYVNDFVAFKLDAAGHYSTARGIDDWNHTLLYGPQLTLHKKRRTAPFTHALAGVAVEHVKIPSTPGSSARDIYFTLNLGAGIDIKIHGGAAFRPVQIDWRYSRLNRDTFTGMRLSAGFVYRFQD
jgi:hypothetical protein